MQTIRFVTTATVLASALGIAAAQDAASKDAKARAEGSTDPARWQIVLSDHREGLQAFAGAVQELDPAMREAAADLGRLLERCRAELRDASSPSARDAARRRLYADAAATLGRTAERLGTLVEGRAAVTARFERVEAFMHERAATAREDAQQVQILHLAARARLDAIERQAEPLKAAHQSDPADRRALAELRKAWVAHQRATMDLAVTERRSRIHTERAKQFAAAEAKVAHLGGAFEVFAGELAIARDGLVEDAADLRLLADDVAALGAIRTSVTALERLGPAAEAADALGARTVDVLGVAIETGSDDDPVHVKVRMPGFEEWLATPARAAEPAVAKRSAHE